jgi:hypothetical protein
MKTLPPLHLSLEHLAETEAAKISHSLLDASPVLGHDFSRRTREDGVNLLKRLVLGLGHEEDLVDLADKGNASVEAQCKSGASHGVLHGGEVVCHDEGGEEEESVRSGHAIASEIGGVYFRWDDYE